MMQAIWLCLATHVQVLSLGRTSAEPTAKAAPGLELTLGIALHITALWYTALYCTALHITALWSSIFYCTAPYCTLLNCIAPNYALLDCSVRCSGALHLTALHQLQHTARNFTELRLNKLHFYVACCTAYGLHRAGIDWNVSALQLKAQWTHKFGQIYLLYLLYCNNIIG